MTMCEPPDCNPSTCPDQRAMPPAQPTGYYCANCGKAVTKQLRSIADEIVVGGSFVVIQVSVENLPCGDLWLCKPGDEGEATRA